MIDEFSGDFLQQLRGFYYVAQLGSMGQAAKVMHRSQSSVSRLIKQLEDSLGFELFSRVQKGVVLTSEGNELFKQAVAIFEHIRSIHSELGQRAQEPAGEVTFQVSHSAFLRFVAPLLPEFHKKYPALKLNILEAAGLFTLHKRLEERQIDFVLMVGGALPNGLDSYPLYKDKMVLVAPESMNGSITDPVDLEKLPDLPLIKLPGGTAFSLFIDNHLPAAWLASRECLVAGNAYYQMNMVAAGLGFAVTTEAALTLTPELPLKAHSLSHIMPEQEYVLAKLHNSYMTPQAKAVVEFLTEKSLLKP